MNIVTLFLSLFLIIPAYSYIPKTRTIVKNIADKRGDRSRLLTTELVFTVGKEKVLITEKWYIKDDSNIYLEASGPGFSYKALHRDGKRYRLNDKGQVVSLATDVKFYMPFLISADPNVIAKYLVNLGVAPDGLLKRQEARFKLDEITHEPEEGVRLTRLDGVVTYGLGQPMPKDSNQTTKHVWVIQDQFHIKKLRGEDFTLELSNYDKFKGGFWFAKSSSLNWNEINVESSTVSLVPINVGPITKKKFEFSNLQEQPQSANSIPIPEIDAFYKNFR